MPARPMDRRCDRCRCRARTAARRVACRTGGSRRSSVLVRRATTSARPSTVSSPTSGRSSLISTVSPGSLSASTAERSSTSFNGAPSTSSNRSPGSSTSSDGLDFEALGALVVGDEAHHLADQHVSGHDRHVVSDSLQRHVLRDLFRGPHRLEPEHATLLRRLEAELLLLGEELHGRFVAADEPRQDRLRRFGDGDEVEVARRRELLGETLELTERDPLVDWLRRRRHPCVGRGLDLVDPPVQLVGDELGRQQAGRADCCTPEERHADDGDRPPAMAGRRKPHPGTRIDRDGHRYRLLLRVGHSCALGRRAHCPGSMDRRPRRRCPCPRWVA